MNVENGWSCWEREYVQNNFKRVLWGLQTSSHQQALHVQLFLQSGN